MLETREGGCHCGRVRFRAEVDLDLMSHCSCSVCTKKGILHLGTDPATFQLLRGKNALTSYTFGTGVAQHTFCSQCGMPLTYPGRGDIDMPALQDLAGSRRVDVFDPFAAHAHHMVMRTGVAVVARGIV